MTIQTTSSAATQIADLAMKYEAIPSGVNNENFLIFLEELRAAARDIHKDIFGMYGALFLIVSDAEWDHLLGNIRADGTIVQKFRSPDPLGPEPDVPAHDATAAIFNRYNAVIGKRKRDAEIRLIVSDIESALNHLFINKRVMGKAVAASAEGSGTADEIALDSPAIRLARIRAELGRPTKGTLKIWLQVWYTALSDSFSNWLAAAISSSRKLAMYGEDLTMTQKLHALEKAMEDSSVYEQILSQYRMQHPDPTLRTFNELCEYIKEQADNITAAMTRTTAGYNALPSLIYSQADMDEAIATAATAAPPPRTYTQHEYDAAIQRERGQARKPSSSGGGSGGGGGGGNRSGSGAYSGNTRRTKGTNNTASSSYFVTPQLSTFAHATPTATSQAIGDSGCGELLLKHSARHILDDIHPFTNMHVRVANNGIIQSEERGTLRVSTPSGSDISLTGYIFAEGTLSHNLAGFSNFCNKGCTVTLTQTGIDVSRDGITIWAGTKAPTDKLWYLNLESIGAHAQPTHIVEAMSTLKLDSDAEYVRFVHAALGSPPISTLLNAVSKGWLNNLPRLTTRMIRQNTPDLRNTALGHLDQTRQGQHSTRSNATAAEVNQDATAAEVNPDDTAAEDDHDALNTLRFSIHLTSEWINASDATGAFNCPSFSNWKYILVSIMNGYIHLELMHDRTKEEYLRVYHAMYAFYKNLHKKPTKQILDNETSAALENFLKDKANAEIQYVPPGMHRQNKSERAIRPSKNCIISMLTTTDPEFPAALLFDEVTTQAEIVINQLKAWHLDPTVNAWTGMHGKPYDHMMHPISVYGMKCVIYDNPLRRGSWATHGVDGFYLSPAMHHYRCWNFWVCGTRANRVSDTVEWLPKPYCMPGHSPLEALTAAVRDVAGAISKVTKAEKSTLSYRSPVQQQQLLAGVQSLHNLFTPSSASDTPISLDTVSNTDRETEVFHGPSPPVPHTHVHWASDTPSAEEHRVAIPSAAEQRVTETPSAAVQRVAGTPRTKKFKDPRRQPQRKANRRRPIPPAESVDEIIAEHHHIMDQTPMEQPSTTPSYKWRAATPSSKRKSKQQNYFSKINELFTDDVGTQRVVGIDTNVATSKGAGSKTLFYRYYCITDHMSPPTNDNDYDHIPCAELLRDSAVEWTEADTVAMAMSTDTTPLNLNSDGTPLTLTKGLASEFHAEWQEASDNEVRKLITTTETMEPIHKCDIPADRRGDITYYNRVPKEKIKEGALHRRVRGTAGGDRINYPGPVTARTASLEVVRALWNSTLADEADICTADITDYYLGTPMERKEYLRMTRKQLGAIIIAEYDLEQYIINDIMHFQINKGMYGLPQAGLLAQQRLVKHLGGSGYMQSDIVPCLFRHVDNGITFVLVVDDFGIKYTNPAGRDHLLATLRQKYKITYDPKGEHYLGMTVKHDKVAKTITISMPGYIDKMLIRFHSWLGTHTAASPGVFREPAYGAKVQKPVQDDTPPLSPAETTTLQGVIGSILYYARAVDPTMLTICNTIASEQAKPTEAVKAHAVRLLQYAARYPNNEIVFHKSKMHLIIQGDASFNSRPKGRSVAGGIAYCGDADDPTTENGMLHAISSIIDVVCASAGEAEYGAAYINAQYGVGLRHILIALGHPQPATPILCDNEFAIGLATDTIKQRKSKSIDLRFHWIRDRIRQGQFTIRHVPGEQILADFFTKTLSAAKHQAMMPRLVRTPTNSSALGDWQCVGAGRHRQNTQA
jgi:uncharacterized membrane protein YgcG